MRAGHTGRASSRVVACFFLLLVAAGYADAAATDIKNVVVITFENRSFDHFLGWLKTEANAEIDGLTGTESNPVTPGDPSSPVVTVSPDAVYVGPSPDHSVPSTTDQIYGTLTPPAGATPPMDGFVASLESGQPGQGPLVMRCFNSSALPVFQTLATEYAIFDAFFASVPGPTEVNRLYIFSCTSHGAAENDGVDLAIGYPQPTVFGKVAEAGLTWRDYFSDFPTAFFLSKNRDPGQIENFRLLPEFFADAAAGTLPNLSVIEPAYFSTTELLAASDAHPNHLVNLADQFLKDVYEALVASPQWNSTLLIVTFDEHGGFFDHVPTPLDVPNPDGLVSTTPPFNFTRLGVRVPVIMASPWLAAGTVVHSGVGPTATSQYDHTSIYATLREIWGLNGSLTERDAWASTFTQALNELESPRTDCPMRMPPIVFRPSVAELTRQCGFPLSDFQAMMAFVADSLDGTNERTLVDWRSVTNAEGGALVRRAVADFIDTQLAKRASE